ncbi:hypothetical protein LTR50_004889 [Elasticomyces elasticus]|nr:hypothetical protein LTR50_004889 [Elasticomyces elasticus]
MEASKDHNPTREVDRKQGCTDSSVAKGDHKSSEADSAITATKRTSKCEKSLHHQKSRSTKNSQAKRATKENSSSDSSSDSETDSNSGISATSSSEDEREKRKALRKRRLRNKTINKKDKRSRKYDSSEESEDDITESESDEDSSGEERRRSKHKRSKKSRRYKDSDSEESDSDDNDCSASNNESEKGTKVKSGRKKRSRLGTGRRTRLELENEIAELKLKRKLNIGGRKDKKGKKARSLDYKRVDQLWDDVAHNYKLKESAEDDENEFSEFLFLVRRVFDWENRYTKTLVEIKSKVLVDALQVVMKNCKSVSLEAEEPNIEPNMLFLYLEEFRTHYQKTLKPQLKQEKKKKLQRKIKLQIAQVRVLVKYLDNDYTETKKTLYPLLKVGNITFDLLWALFKPNTLAITSCYGAWDEPRCFKVDHANKFCSVMKGEWYTIEGRYLEYDGKAFGMGDFEIDVESFKGPRKISSLATYPLVYHKNPEGVTTQLIERGKRFVAMAGMNYQYHKGLAFQKKKKTVAKININGRIMVDPATFRRINPNYRISLIKTTDSDEMWGGSEYEKDSDCSCSGGSDSDDADAPGGGEEKLEEEKEDKPRIRYKMVTNERGQSHVLEVEVDGDGDEIKPEDFEELATTADGETGEVSKREFTDHELLLASPVVLGFAFSEKLWLEFSLSGVHEITYNEGAFESLVLPSKQKSIIKALVECHKFHAAKTIDDVVENKGKGLVVVLHGSPGTGKTLTAEGIAELIRCPLYMVSAGELGTDPGHLEHELQKIMDVAHSWGAVLLLDEADVFLEKREVHDVHRNALVSIFLRLLEYFQGVLFLTTNRVETFDDAFQSRIHVALRYGELTAKAKKTVWKMFLGMVRKSESLEGLDPFNEAEYDMLSRHNLNGRQIKNTVRTAQALAINEKQTVAMEHIKRVLDVAESFARDLKGGTGFEEAMRSYT